MPASNFPASGSVYSVPSVVKNSGTVPSLIGYPPPAETLAFLDHVLKHGGPRTPGPGRKQGRPAKKPKEKATCTTITLSSPKTLKTLQKRAKKAQLTPGAYIERELKLSVVGYFEIK